MLNSRGFSISPWLLPLLILVASLVPVLVSSGSNIDENKYDPKRVKRQFLFRTFNNTIDGPSILAGSASFGLSAESAGSLEFPYFKVPSMNLSTATTTTAQPTTTTSAARDLSQDCTCIDQNGTLQCITFRDIYTACLSAVQTNPEATCLNNLDELCNNLKSQASG